MDIEMGGLGGRAYSGWDGEEDSRGNWDGYDNLVVV